MRPENPPPWTMEEVRRRLEALSEDDFLQQYNRFGIDARGGLGVRTPQIKALAKAIGPSVDLALSLWDQPIHEMKLLAIRVMHWPDLTEDVIWQWSRDIYSWDVCDSACLHLFRKAPFAHDLSFQLANEEELFVRRVGLVLMTALSIHDKKMAVEKIESYLQAAAQYASDERMLIKKAVSWLLRQVGKSGDMHRDLVLPVAEKLVTDEKKSCQWIGKDVLRELRRR